MTYQKLTKNAARCRLCNTTVESTHRHDFRWCACGEMFVDGGLEYVRRGAKEDINNLEELSEFVEEEREERVW